ncbi:uncharacterized protein VNE69_06199 [Vairimorpha necatrix]|uniref:Uncharacterized protein n=1 Tax=Vairimorpha necatrix TaxID=6039 RepID=A0AAX4JDC9_9MICR
MFQYIFLTICTKSFNQTDESQIAQSDSLAQYNQKRTSTYTLMDDKNLPFKKRKGLYVFWKTTESCHSKPIFLENNDTKDNFSERDCENIKVKCKDTSQNINNDNEKNPRTGDDWKLLVQTLERKIKEWNDEDGKVKRDNFKIVNATVPKELAIYKSTRIKIAGYFHKFNIKSEDEYIEIKNFIENQQNIKKEEKLLYDQIHFFKLCIDYISNMASSTKVQYLYHTSFLISIYGKMYERLDFLYTEFNLIKKIGILNNILQMRCINSSQNHEIKPLRKIEIKIKSLYRYLKKLRKDCKIIVSNLEDVRTENEKNHYWSK